LANIDGQLRRLRDLYVRFGDLSQQDYEQERDNLLALRAEIEGRQEPPVASSLQIDGIWDAVAVRQSGDAPEPAVRPHSLTSAGGRWRSPGLLPALLPRIDR
jgi:hypothetical protein